MRGALAVLLIVGLSACRSAGAIPDPAAPGAKEAPGTAGAVHAPKGIDSLDVALYLFPFAKEHLATLRKLNLTGRLPGPPVPPEDILGLYLDMLRRHFKSVTLFDNPDAIPKEGYDLHYGLNLLIIFGFVSGKKAEVHLTSHIWTPDREKLEHILYDVAKPIPEPAVSSMIREAAEEARDLTEKRIKESVRLREYARTR
jgi:hypothetical protein